MPASQFLVRVLLLSMVARGRVSFASSLRRSSKVFFSGVVKLELILESIEVLFPKLTTKSGFEDSEQQDFQAQSKEHTQAESSKYGWRVLTEGFVVWMLLLWILKDCGRSSTYEGIEDLIACGEVSTNLIRWHQLSFAVSQGPIWLMHLSFTHRTSSNLYGLGWKIHWKMERDESQ